MADERDDIRARIDIVELVGQSVRLTRAGKTWKGLCPFHPDKNPSFTVSSETGRYKCWSCGEGGDIFTWVMKTQNVDFIEAMRTLAKQAGIELATRGVQTPPSVRAAQETAMDTALAFFRDQLSRSETAKEYCERRGISPETINEWELGYAPDAGRALAGHLRKLGFATDLSKELFLIDENAQGEYYDKFRGRLMFPIRDEKGSLVGFSGRLLGDGHPKYINSSDTPLYRKSKVLYGMNRGRDRISKERRAVLTEGAMDVIACFNAGVSIALASLGTAFSEDQAKLLKRWCEEVVIFYDSDAAGQKAASRAITILQNEGLRVRVSLLPEGDDPDTLLKRSGPVAVQKAVDDSLSPTEYAIQALLRRRSPEEEAFWTEAVEILAHAPNQMELEKHMLKLAAMYPGLRDPVKAERALRRLVVAQRRQSREGIPHERIVATPQHHHSASDLSSAELTVFLAFLSSEFRRSAWWFARATHLFMTKTASEISAAISKAFPTAPPEGKPSDWLHLIEPESLQELLADILQDFRAENLTEGRLADSVELLKREHASRDVEVMKRSEDMNDAKRQEILTRLRQLKPDAKAKPKEEDEWF